MIRKKYIHMYMCMDGTIPLHVSNDRADNCLHSRITRSVNSFGYFVITRRHNSVVCSDTAPLFQAVICINILRKATFTNIDGVGT